MSKIKHQNLQSTLKSWDEVDALLKEISFAEAETKKLEGKMNEQILNIQQKYQPSLDANNSLIVSHTNEIKLFCDAHKSEFTEVKTKTLNFGEVGFRTGTPKVTTLKGFTWGAVLELIKNSKKFASKFIRIREEIDKNSIITSGTKKEELAKLGCTISQDEYFFLEPYFKESV